MSFRKHVQCLVFCALLSFPPYRITGQAVAPVQADLVQRLDASKVQVGDSVLAKLAAPWKGSDCDLRAGAIIQGHVVSQKIHSKTERTSQIGIAFDRGQCAGREMKPLFLTIAAAVAPHPVRDSELPGAEEMQPLNSAVGVTLNGNVSRGNGGNTMRSVSQASDTVFLSARRAKAEPTIKPGQVVGIPHVTIAVGQGPQGASIFSCAGRNVQLIPGTQFLLVPNLNAAAAPAAAAQGANTDAGRGNTLAEAVAPSPPTIADEKEFCAAPDCTVVLGDTLADQSSDGPQMTIPLKELGYLPPSADREMPSFDYDASIAYLGPAQFLFTYNPHTLVPRSGAEADSFRKLRIVRGVLIDLEKKEIVKTVDWRVPDSGRYLWPISDNRVLIHVGQELRIYGPGLQLRHQISLAGPLAFVRVSPKSEYFAVGVIHERHSREIHRQLEAAEQREPEEDTEVRLLDSQFKVLTTIMRSSRLAPPALLNEGEVQIPSIGHNRWRIVENSWAGQRRVLAVAMSTCMPLVESLPGNLLFLMGCDRQTGNRWYRILHGDGKVVLKGWSRSSELEQTAGGNVGSNAFAIRIAESSRSRITRALFTVSDLTGTRVTVYRTLNGRRLFSVGLTDPVPAVQTFAISPREDQVALLKSGEIAFYRVSGAE